MRATTDDERPPTGAQRRRELTRTGQYASVFPNGAESPTARAWRPSVTLTVEALELRDDRWVLQKDEGSAELRRWSNGRDTLEVRAFSISPNIPAPLSRPDLMWKLRRLEGLFQQVAPVEIKTGMLDGNEYVSEIIKVSMNGRLTYRGSLIIPKASFSLMFSVMAECDAADGERELHVAEVTLRDVSNMDERELAWFRDPFSFPVVSPVGRTCADDETWDARYPEHPLSRIRTIFRDLVGRCTVSADVSRATSFSGPGPTPELERGIDEAAESLTVGHNERSDLATLSQTLAVNLERALNSVKFDSSTEHLSSSSGVAASFADRVAKRVAKHVPRLCLMMYSSQRNPMFYHSIQVVSAFHASRHGRSANDAEELALAEALHSEFVISRLLRAVNITCVSVRTPYLDRSNTGVALVPATDADWLAKFITLCEMASLIVCGTTFNPNTSKEVGIAFGIERNKNKFLYRSSDAKFHLGSEQEHAFGIEQLPQAAAYVIAKDLGVSASVSRRA